ncbi:MAG: hypothetical protein L3J07_00845 [Candidatus Magasanikbacteria bacterium]|nr:hypothetical protein [Candidatus Magasanikbacteria bacterium]
MFFYVLLVCITIFIIWFYFAILRVQKEERRQGMILSKKEFNKAILKEIFLSFTLKKGGGDE